MKLQHSTRLVEDQHPVGVLTKERYVGTRHRTSDVVHVLPARRRATYVCTQKIEAVLKDGVDEIVLPAEIQVNRALRDSRRFREILDTGVIESVSAEEIASSTNELRARCASTRFSTTELAIFRDSGRFVHTSLRPVAPYRGCHERAPVSREGRYPSALCGLRPLRGVEQQPVAGRVGNPILLADPREHPLHRVAL